MKLSDENARQLTRLIWRERLRTWAPGVAGLALLIAALVVVQSFQGSRADAVVSVEEHQAVVTAVVPAPVGRGVQLKLHLDDGRDISANASLAVYPQKGNYVRVSDARHASGRHTFSLLPPGK